MSSVTTMAGAQPRIRIEWGGTADSLGAVLRAALDLLDAGGRIRLVGPDEPADVVHSVGDFLDDRPDRGTSRRVHTVPRVPLRRGRLAPARWWARHERRQAGAETTWLAHGRVAAGLLVASGAAPGDLVHWLPIVAPVECWPTGRVDRSAVRARLAVPPGVALVLECVPPGAQHTVGDWASQVGARRTDVLALRCTVPVPKPAPEAAAAAAEGALSFAQLLAAADLFVAGRRGLTAENPGVAAVAAGVPVIAVTTDSTAELVRSGRNGFVVPPDPGSIAEAVRAYLDGELPHTCAQAVSAGAEPVLEELARGLLRAYHCALIHGTRRGPDR